MNYVVGRDYPNEFWTMERVLLERITQRRFPNLVKIDFSDCTDLRAVRYLPQHSTLKHLVLNRVHLDAEELTNLRKFKHLKSLRAGGNSILGGELVAFFPMMGNLQDLMLGGCDLVPRDLRAISIMCPRLRRLELNYNQKLGGKL